MFFFCAREKTLLEERDFEQGTYYLLNAVEKDLLRDILHRHSAITLHGFLRLSKEDLRKRDEYYLIRVVNRAQPRMLAIAAEEVDNLKQLLKLKEVKELPGSGHRTINKVKRLEEEIAQQSHKMMQYFFEASAAFDVMKEKGFRMFGHINILK